MHSETVKSFYKAVKRGEIATVEAMVKVTPELVSTRHEQATPLHFAAIENQREMVDLLLRSHADLNARDDEFNMTPIGWANEKGHRNMVEYLASQGAKMDLYSAAALGLTDRVRQFLAESSVEVNEFKHYGAPIHEASLWGHVEIVKLLLAHGADASLRNTHGQTALEIALSQLETRCRSTPIVNDSRRTEIESGCREVVDLLQGNLIAN